MKPSPRSGRDPAIRLGLLGYDPAYKPRAPPESVGPLRAGGRVVRSVLEPGVWDSGWHGFGLPTPSAQAGGTVHGVGKPNPCHPPDRPDRMIPRLTRPRPSQNNGKRTGGKAPGPFPEPPSRAGPGATRRPGSGRRRAGRRRGRRRLHDVVEVHGRRGRGSPSRAASSAVILVWRVGSTLAVAVWTALMSDWNVEIWAAVSPSLRAS